MTSSQANNRPNKWVAITILALLAGCNGPVMMIPGGKLEGTEAPLPAAGSEGGVLTLETRPADPYSVKVGYVVVAGHYLIDPAAERTWYQHLAIDPQVRVRFEGSDVIHPARTEPETNPATLTQFEAQRKVLRIVPRS